ncbi:hypothetical protein LSUB1_G007696 [Lachnellula subtilissima]|uniref:F-box domain-containing protein n=1 Tax=Lachnellula subtilissima TaxID=602034 RepID=A0A8H8U7P1_9HELO|nr:hypothetical protein LSUB1_G007696 [Lachnellula subtilissima]
MASSILAIPDEICLRIAGLLDPRALLQFALTHHRALRCSQDLLRRHQTWDVKYQIVHDRSPLFVPKLLTEGLLDPRAGLWHLRRFESWGTRLNWGDWETFDVNSHDYSLGPADGPVERDDYTCLNASYYSNEILEAMEGVMQRQLFLSETETEKWMDGVRVGSDEVLKDLMMALAPNLHTVIFIAHSLDGYHPLSFLGQAISRIAESSPMPMWPPGFGSLTRISVASYTDLQHPHNNFYCPFSAIACLFRLPNLKDLILNVVGYQDSEEWELPASSSSIERLKLSCCETSQETLEKLVNACRRLKCLEVDRSLCTESLKYFLLSNSHIENTLERINGVSVDMWLKGKSDLYGYPNVPRPRDDRHESETQRTVWLVDDCLVKVDDGAARDDAFELENYLPFHFPLRRNTVEPTLWFQLRDLRDLDLPPKVKKLSFRMTHNRQPVREYFVKPSPQHQPAVARLLLQKIVELVEDPRYSSLKQICLFDLVGVPVHIDEWNDDDTVFVWDEDAYRKIVARSVDLHRPSRDGPLTREEEQTEKRIHREKHADPNVEILHDIHMTDPRIGHPFHAGKVFPIFES